ncbi:winged helix-turn-helix domain-containing protein [Paenibacillus sp. TRM 82003]|nr:winged helix-turn-helix domain-containing protein [Paenibacillus sp. TRM 82003]
MQRIEFHRGEWRVSCGGETLTLLPKEYQLLEYFHSHAGVTMTRDQLLDAVWPMEAPTDRTVDDHVYRLRKKLAAWSDAFDLRTVRGAGYRFETRSSERAAAHPLLANADYAEHAKRIFYTNILYGRGDALLALAKQRAVLGFELDPLYTLYVHFVEGDFRAIRDASATFDQKLFYWLHLYHFLKPRASRPYVERAIREGRMYGPWQEEMENIDILFMMWDWGETEEAKRRLEGVIAASQQGEAANMLPYLLNMALEFALLEADWPRAAADANVLEARLAELPFQREEGRFRIMKGLMAYRERPSDGLALIDNGLETLRRSRFLPHYGAGLKDIRQLAERHGWPELTERYQSEWDRFIEQSGVAEILPHVEAELRRHLGP